MITKISEFKLVLEGNKLISDTAKPKKGKMHKVLGIPEDKEIHDVYTSGKKLASALIAKVGKKKAQGMLAFAANINSAHDIFDKALSALKSIDEAINSTKLAIKQLYSTFTEIDNDCKNDENYEEIPFSDIQYYGDQINNIWFDSNKNTISKAESLAKELSQYAIKPGLLKSIDEAINYDDLIPSTAFVRTKTTKMGKVIPTEYYVEVEIRNSKGDTQVVAGPFYDKKEADDALIEYKEYKSQSKKESLEPVGAQDADVNNDGNVDNQDKYIMRRRSAINKTKIKTEETK